MYIKMRAGLDFTVIFMVSSSAREIYIIVKLRGWKRGKAQRAIGERSRRLLVGPFACPTLLNPTSLQYIALTTTSRSCAEGNATNEQTQPVGSTRPPEKDNFWSLILGYLTHECEAEGPRAQSESLTAKKKKKRKLKRTTIYPLRVTDKIPTKLDSVVKLEEKKYFEAEELGPNMKRLNIFYLSALLLLAFEISEASLIPRGKPKTKKKELTHDDYPFVCLDDPVGLPDCNFNAEEYQDETEGRKTARDLIYEPRGDFPFGEGTTSKPGATVVVYKFEGCLPTRLPFRVPVCREEDTNGRIVDVQRLYPYPHKNDTDTPDDVLQPLDMEEWRRGMAGPWIRPRKVKKALESAKGALPSDSSEESNLKKSSKTKKVVEEKMAPKKRVSQKLSEDSPSKKLDENDIFSKFPSPTATDKNVADDPKPDPESYKTRSSRRNRIVTDVSSQDSNGEIISQIVETKKKKPSLQQRHVKTILSDSEKLMLARLRSYMGFTAQAFPGTEEDLEIFAKKLVQVGESENRKLPRNQARPSNPKKLHAVSERPKQHLPKKGSEFPYHRAIHYNPENLRLANARNKFPYNRVPLDVFTPAKYGKEIRKIPYVAKKLEEHKAAILPITEKDKPSKWLNDEPLTNSDKSGAVPFDTSMLDAAKEGGIFPYAKERPEHTSKSWNTDQASRTNGDKVPVKQVRTFSDDVQTSFKQFSANKEQTQLANLRAGRQLEDNVIIVGNGEKMAHKNAGETLKRVPRKASESHGDFSVFSDNIEIPGKWSEFPYSKAIPFDPERLRRPRSSIEFY